MLTRIVCTILLVWVVAGQTASSGKAEDAEPKEREFVIKNFHTEGGPVLPEARLVYGTMGTLNAAGKRKPGRHARLESGHGGLHDRRPSRPFHPQGELLSAGTGLWVRIRVLRSAC